MLYSILTLFTWITGLILVLVPTTTDTQKIIGAVLIIVVMVCYFFAPYEEDGFYKGGLPLQKSIEDKEATEE